MKPEEKIKLLEKELKLFREFAQEVQKYNTWGRTKSIGAILQEYGMICGYSGTPTSRLKGVGYI